MLERLAVEFRRKKFDLARLIFFLIFAAEHKTNNMKKLFLSVLVVGLMATVSCNKDDDSKSDDDGCQTCASYEYEANGQTITVPAIEVCELANGNAEVMGEDTTVEFSTYIAALEQLTTCN